MSTATHGSSRQRLCRLGAALGAAAALVTLSACGGGGGGSSSSPSSTTNPPVNAQAVTKTQAIPAGGGTVSLAPTGSSTLNVVFPAGAVPANTSVTVATIPQNTLPVAITHVRSKGAQPHFTANSNNVYVVAFQISATGITAFNVPVNVGGGSGLTSLPANTVLNVAQLQSGAWVDVATVTTNAQGGLTPQQVSASLPGLTQPGTYVVYQPASGTSTAVANYGIALLSDDVNGALEVVNLYDVNGNPLATPTVKSLSFPNASDLDGDALTPDGTEGILVDGSNTVRFFSQANTGVPLASTNTVDISNYGGDGDSVAILPTGDEAVVSGDSTSLLVISGIVGGSPQTATTITLPDVRDGLDISNDGKVLMARGPSGLTVYSVTGTASTAGPLGGQIAHTFTQSADIATAGTGGNLEDGRDGMAFSPKDSSRAVVIGDPTGSPTISLLTGLPNAAAVSSVRLQLPAARAHTASRPSERGVKPHLALTGVNRATSVAVTPDGKSAIVGTDAGLVLVSGVDTGTLAQVGTVFSPTFTVNAQSYTLASITTLGITLDGKYVVACTQQPSYGQGTLLVIPITSTGFGTPVGQLSGIAIPDNDQILMH